MASCDHCGGKGTIEVDGSLIICHCPIGEDARRERLQAKTYSPKRDIVDKVFDPIEAGLDFLDGFVGRDDEDEWEYEDTEGEDG